mgnify:FL=1
MSTLFGRIADIERSSYADGPGMRTVVFFKGCPLHCAWCHNPECISPEIETMFYTEKCIGCGRCAEGCYSGAKVVCGKDYAPDALMRELLSDRGYFGEKGGVTFSGGEPLMQREFLREMITLCEKENVRSAVETSLVYFDEDIFARLQVVMADFKAWDSGIHKKYTGVGNGGIIENFKRLDSLGVPIIVRTPIIPGVEQGTEEIERFAASLKNTVKYEKLPYHSLGVGKSHALGREQRDFTEVKQ